MSDYEFEWKETEVHKLKISVNEVVGVEVWYQPTDSLGIVKEKDGKFYIEWPDAENTYLDTQVGREVLRECKPF